jgi:hypothetical protein
MFPVIWQRISKRFKGEQLYFRTVSAFEMQMIISSFVPYKVPMNSFRCVKKHDGVPVELNVTIFLCNNGAFDADFINLPFEL